MSWLHTCLLRLVQGSQTGATDPDDDSVPSVYGGLVLKTIWHPGKLTTAQNVVAKYKNFGKLYRNSLPIQHLEASSASLGVHQPKH
jgi:hypothetical protein